MKSTGCYEYAALLTCLFWFVGCGGSMPSTVSGSAQGPVTTMSRATSRFLYVVNSIEETVQGFAIDAATGGLTAVGLAVATDDAPIYAAATPDGKFLYVANAGTKAIGVSGYRINGTTGELTATVPAEFATTGDTQPFGIAVDATSTRLYTTNHHSISAFTIDPATGALSDVPGTPVAIPDTNLLGTLALTPNGQFLYAADVQNSSVWEFSVTASGLPQRIGSVPTGRYPVGIAVDSAGRFVYVANWVSNDISRYSITPETGALVAASSTTAMPDGCNPQELAVDAAAQSLFVSCPALGIIERFTIDPASGALSNLLSFPTGPLTQPRGVAVDGSGSFVYSAWNMQNRASATAIDSSGALNAVSGAPATGRGPIGLALSGHQ